MKRDELRGELLRINLAVRNQLKDQQTDDGVAPNDQLCKLEKALLMLCALLNPDWTVDDINTQFISAPMDETSLSMVLWSLNRLTEAELQAIASILAEESS